MKAEIQILNSTQLMDWKLRVRADDMVIEKEKKLAAQVCLTDARFHPDGEPCGKG